MKIEHIAVFSPDIRKLRDFYVKYFEAKSNSGYRNEKTAFTSYFLEFDEGARLEIMNKPAIKDLKDYNREYYGYAHIAIRVDSKQRVIDLTNKLKQDGYKIVGNPRTTGDGYFESVILDPDCNRVEITC